MAKKRKTLGLALGSGGSRGACHIGAIQALIENDIPIDFITGSSMGAVVGGAYASGADIYEMEKRLLTMRIAEVFDMNVLPVSAGGLLKGRSAEKKLKPFLKCENIEETMIPFACTAVDIRSGKMHIFRQGDLLKAIRCSFSIPGVFEPVEHDGMLLVDGGLLERLPINELKRMNADVIISIDALGEVLPLNKKPNLFAIMMRAFNIVDWEKTQELHNDGDNFIITPDMSARSQFSAKTIPAAIEAGKKAVNCKIDEIKKMLRID